MMMQENSRALILWARDPFLFFKEALGVDRAHPRRELLDTYIDGVRLFDDKGYAIYHDLSFYERWMFDDPLPQKGDSMQLTWQQTILMTAYHNALRTFDAEHYEKSLRFISVRSGHGIGKSSSLALIIIHFLITIPSSQIGATANTYQQLVDILGKEVSIWLRRLPEVLRTQIEQTDDMVRIRGTRDWYARFRTASKDTRESLAGIHSPTGVLMIADEASAIAREVFEVAQGSLTGKNHLMILTGNPTRPEGFFYDTHREGSHWTRLHFSSLDSPVIDNTYTQRLVDEYGIQSDEYKVRVLGDFPSTAEMDDHGYIPLFNNVRIFFEPDSRSHILKGCILGVDPSGQGKDRTIACIRDSTYLKEVFQEATSSPVDLARKVEQIALLYDVHGTDIIVDGFGVGAPLIAQINTRHNEPVTALLTDKPRENDERFASYKAELAWRFREWLVQGGIILGDKKKWMIELEKVRFKRNLAGKITLMPKHEFKKMYGFSPDLFDSALYTFHKEFPFNWSPLTPAQQDRREMEEAIRTQRLKTSTSLSSV